MADVNEKKPAVKSKKSRFSFKSMWKAIAKFFREHVSEFKKIVWPTRKTVWNNLVVTIVLCAAVGIVIWLLDFGLSFGITKLLG